MPPEKILETAGMTLWYHPERKIIHHEMHRYPGASTLETVLNRGLELFVVRKATKWLSDDRKGGALPKSHHEWGERVWGPKAAAMGWRHWALLPPTELLGKMNMQRLASTYAALGVTAEVFTDLDRAFGWLSTRQ